MTPTKIFLLAILLFAIGGTLLAYAIPFGFFPMILGGGLMLLALVKAVVATA